MDVYIRYDMFFAIFIHKPFIFAIIDSPNSGRMFQASLFATIAIPILLWIYLWCIQKFMERKKNQQDNVDEN